MIDDLRQDLTYSVRTMRRNPLFAAIVVLTLGLGIAANSSIFTLVNAVMLKAQLGEPLEGEYPPELVERYPEIKSLVTTSLTTPRPSRLLS